MNKETWDDWSLVIAYKLLIKFHPQSPTLQQKSGRLPLLQLWQVRPNRYHSQQIAGPAARKQWEAESKAKRQQLVHGVIMGAVSALGSSDFLGRFMKKQSRWERNLIAQTFKRTSKETGAKLIWHFFKRFFGIFVVRGVLSVIFPHFHRFCSGVYRFSSICAVSSRFFLSFLIFRCAFYVYLGLV